MNEFANDAGKVVAPISLTHVKEIPLDFKTYSVEKVGTGDLSVALNRSASYFRAFRLDRPDATAGRTAGHLALVSIAPERIAQVVQLIEDQIAQTGAVTAGDLLPKLRADIADVNTGQIIIVGKTGTGTNQVEYLHVGASSLARIESHTGATPGYQILDTVGDERFEGKGWGMLTEAQSVVTKTIFVANDADARLLTGGNLPQLGERSKSRQVMDKHSGRPESTWSVAQNPTTFMSRVAQALPGAELYDPVHIVNAAQTLIRTTTGRIPAIIAIR